MMMYQSTWFYAKWINKMPENLLCENFEYLLIFHTKILSLLLFILYFFCFQTTQQSDAISGLNEEQIAGNVLRELTNYCR